MKKMDKKAFTLIEVIVVVAVIGILVLLAVPRFIGHTQKAELVRIQNDVKVMEREMGAELINGDDFNKWKNNMKDLNQLAQEDKLFEKEGFATDPIDASHLTANKTVDLTKLNVGGDLHELTEDLSISETYKVIPERYKDEINSKLKGTFYANSTGKVYYEHVKSLSRILTGSEEEPGYSEEEQKIKDLIENDFIPVATAEELNNVRSATLETYGKGTRWEGEYTGGLDKKYVQVKDIDLLGYGYSAGWNPIGTISARFKGTYDGNGHKITGLTINRSSQDNVGLFGYTDGATIENVSLENVNVTGKRKVGGLVGQAFNNTEISNSYSTGSVTGFAEVGGLVGDTSTEITIENSYATGLVRGGGPAGGLVGQANKSTIKNSYATGSVDIPQSYAGGLVGRAYDGAIENSYATGSVKGTYYVGGLVGEVQRNTINNSYTTGAVTGTELYVGGLVGYAYENNTISNSYATGEVTGRGYVGGLLGKAGLVGSADTHVVISNSYWDTETTGRPSSAGSAKRTGKSTADMKNQATYVNEVSDWNFDTVWAIQEGVSYPTLINNPERH